MNDLIEIQKINIGDAETNTVNARELWEFLGSQRQFADWIEYKVKQCRLKEGFDFIHKFVKNPSGGRPSNEFYVSIDAAKHISMMEGTDRGFEVRDYFIDCERRLKSIDHSKMSKLDILKMALESETERLRLEQKIEDDKEDVEFAQRFRTAHGRWMVGEVAKFIGAGPNKFWEWLRDTRIIMRTSRDTPYQHYFDKGYFDWKLGTYEKNGVVVSSKTLLFTNAGVEWIKPVYEKWAKKN